MGKKKHTHKANKKKTKKSSSSDASMRRQGGDLVAPDKTASMHDSDDDSGMEEGTMKHSAATSTTSSSSSTAKGANDSTMDEAAQMDGASSSSSTATDGGAAAGGALRNPNHRHKLEWRQLRDKINALKRDKGKIRKQNIQKHDERKGIAAEIKELEREFKERTEREMAEWREAMLKAGKDPNSGGGGESTEH